jgi:hypothetical protein
MVFDMGCKAFLRSTTRRPHGVSYEDAGKETQTFALDFARHDTPFWRFVNINISFLNIHFNILHRTARMRVRSAGRPVRLAEPGPI